MLMSVFFLSAINARLRIDFDWIGILLFLCGLGYLVSFINEIKSIDGMSLYLMPLLGLLFCHLLALQSVQKEKIIRIYVMTSLMVFCFSIFMEPFIVVKEYGYLFQGTRLSGFALNPNIAAFYIIAHLLCIKLLSKNIPTILLIISVISIIATFSRSGILCLVVLFIIDFLRNFTAVNKLKIIFLITPILVLFSVSDTMQNIENEYIDKFNFSRLNPYTQKQSLAQDNTRIDAIANYLDGIAESPIFGKGPLEGQSRKVRAHNTILNIWYEVGIFPALAFSFFLVLLFLKGYKQKSLLNVFITCLIFTFFINNLIMHSVFWLLLGCFYIAKRRINLQGRS
ncbi:O-antigen ligase family protein [Porticoccaceae bacterium]|nr:O-antigen ligase family protein [Porticoccaceae bacterium]